MQLLHCLESSARGGENLLVDDWRVADDSVGRVERSADVNYAMYTIYDDVPENTPNAIYVSDSRGYVGAVIIPVK